MPVEGQVIHVMCVMVCLIIEQASVTVVCVCVRVLDVVWEWLSLQAG